MKLSPREIRVINELRAHHTGKITVSKYGGEIRSIRTEIDADLADKARTGLVPRGTGPQGEKISEPVKTEKSLGPPAEVRTKE